MLIKMKIKKGDNVVVLTGKDTGKRGHIIKVIPKKNIVIVSGVNLVKCHKKPTKNTEGGIFTKESVINISNIAIEDPKDGKPTRIGYKFIDNKKVRFARRSGEIING